MTPSTMPALHGDGDIHGHGEAVDDNGPAQVATISLPLILVANLPSCYSAKWVCLDRHSTMMI